MRTCTAVFLVLSAGPGILSAQIDANGNGISDIYERHFNSGQLFGPGFTATGDQDGDGQNNLQESISGTDPLKFDPPEGHLVQTIRHIPATWGQEPGQTEPILLTPEAFEIGWQAVAGKQYRLSSSLSLEGGTWLPVGVPIYGYSGGPILVGCIPEADGGQLPDKFFWRVEASDIDQDGDGLNDYEEILFGTNPETPVTFTGIPDLWLTSHYPSAQGFAPEADDDNDGDGTTDGAEVNQGSNPNNNSDGGAPPEDPIEEVVFTVGGDYACWRMEIQGQGPRDMRLLRLASPVADWPVERTFKLQRNNKYEITLHRVGGYPDWYCWEAGVGGKPGEDTFDYGSTFELEERNENARFLSVADHWLVDNRDGLLTSHLDSEYVDKATGLKATLMPVEFKKLWETNNKANQILVTARRDDPSTPAQTADADDNLYGTPRNFLYVTAVPSDNKYHVSLDCRLTGLPREQFVCAAYIGQTKITGTDQAFQSGIDDPVNLQIPASGVDLNGQDLGVRIAVDENQNGQIDANEVAFDLTATKSTDGTALPPRLRGFSADAVNAAITTIHGQATGTGWTGWKPNWAGDWFVPNAIALLRLFYEGEVGNMVQAYRPTETLLPETLNAFGTPGDFNEWLTHHAGSGFTTDGVTTLQHYKWNSLTRISNLIANSTPLSKLKYNETIATAMASVTNATVESFKQPSVPLGQTQTFPDGASGYDLQAVLAGLGSPHWSPAWVQTQTLLVGDKDGYEGKIPDDAFGTVGRSRFISGEYRFIVKKELRTPEPTPGDPVILLPYTAIVVYLRVSGTSQDLYDFNHQSGTLSIPAAITQLSFGNSSYGRTNGVIFRATVDILHDYEMIIVPVF